MLSSPYDVGLAALAADVITTRPTPAATAASMTRVAPSRATAIIASGSPGSSGLSGDATWSTAVQPATASSQPPSAVRSATTKRSPAPGSTAVATAAVTAASLAGSRTVVRTS